MTQETDPCSLPKDPWWEKLKPRSSPRRITRKRLKQELTVFHAEYCALRQAHEPCEWTLYIDSLLSNCNNALKRGELGVAWHCFKDARRTSLYLLQNQRPEEVQSRAHAIRNEADKKLKDSWRGRTIKEYLPDPKCDQPPVVFEAEKVVMAARLLDGFHDNTYERLSIITSQLNILSTLILLVVLLWLGIAPTTLEDYSMVAGNQISPLIFWLTVILFGCMGAIFSGFVFTSRQGLREAIPDLQLSSSLTIARLSVACLSALITTIFLTSGIINLGQEGFEWILALAFVSGFSEQFVLRTAQALSQP
jgi:hypothetical protein